MPPPSETPDGPVLVQWIFDTRTWYPQVTQTKQLETHVSPKLPQNHLSIHLEASY